MQEQQRLQSHLAHIRNQVESQRQLQQTMPRGVIGSPSVAPAGLPAPDNARNPPARANADGLPQLLRGGQVPVRLNNVGTKAVYVFFRLEGQIRTVRVSPRTVREVRLPTGTYRVVLYRIGSPEAPRSFALTLAENGVDPIVVE